MTYSAGVGQISRRWRSGTREGCQITYTNPSSYIRFHYFGGHLPGGLFWPLRTHTLKSRVQTRVISPPRLRESPFPCMRDYSGHSAIPVAPFALLYNLASALRVSAVTQRCMSSTTSRCRSSLNHSPGLRAEGHL